MAVFPVWGRIPPPPCAPRRRKTFTAQATQPGVSMPAGQTTTNCVGRSPARFPNPQTNMKRTTLFTSLAVALVAGTTHASVLWSATSTSNFKGLEEQDCAGNYGSGNGSSVTIVNDATYGSVFKFHKD